MKKMCYLLTMGLLAGSLTVPVFAASDADSASDKKWVIATDTVFKPFDGQRIIIVRGVFDFGKRLDPVYALAMLGPELIRVFDGLLVHRLVLVFINQRVLCHFRGYRIHLLISHVAPLFPGLLSLWI